MTLAAVILAAKLLSPHADSFTLRTGDAAARPSAVLVTQPPAPRRRSPWPFYAGGGALVAAAVAMGAARRRRRSG